MSRDLDAVFYIEQVPNIEFREGMAHICYDIGRSARFEVVMSPNVYLKALRAANKTADEFHAGHGVVSMRGKG